MAKIWNQNGMHQSEINSLIQCWGSKREFQAYSVDKVENYKTSQKSYNQSPLDFLTT